MTNWYSKYPSNQVFCNGLYVVDNPGASRSSGQYCTSFPHGLAVVELRDLVPVTVWKVNVNGRLSRQPRFAKIFKEIACDVCFINFEHKHMLINPPILGTIVEWLDRKSKGFTPKCEEQKKGEKAKTKWQQWWDYIGLKKMKLISRFLAESLVKLIQNNFTHGDLRNGVALLDGGDLKLCNCEESSTFDYEVDLLETLKILIALGTGEGFDPNLITRDHIRREILSIKSKVPVWFFEFLSNMVEYDPTNLDPAGLDLQLIPPELWTKWEKKRFLEDFYEHHLELTGDRFGVTALFQEDNGAFEWKGSLKKCAEFASRFEDDKGPVSYLNAFHEMMHFWRNMMQHFNEIWKLNKKTGKWEYDSPKSQADCKERIEVMLQLEEYFPFAKRAYKCVIRGYEAKKFSITKNYKLTDEQKKTLLVEPARYIKKFSIMAPLESAEYGGYRAFL